MWITLVVIGIIVIAILIAFGLKKTGESIAEIRIVDSINLLCKERNIQTEEDKNQVAYDVFYKNLISCRDRQDFNMIFPSLVNIAPKVINNPEVLSQLYFDSMRFMTKCGVPPWDTKKFYNRMMTKLPENTRFNM